MNIKSMPIAERETISASASAPHISDEAVPLLLGIVAALLLGAGVMLFDTQTTPTEHHQEIAESIPLAPIITGKTAAQLERELARVNEEMAQVQAEREGMLKAIEEVTYTLNEKLKEANLAQLPIRGENSPH